MDMCIHGTQAHVTGGLNAWYIGSLVHMGMYMHGTHRLIQADVYSTHIPMNTCTLHTGMPVSEQTHQCGHMHTPCPPRPSAMIPLGWEGLRHIHSISQS